MKISKNLGYLVWVVVQIAHHEVIFLGYDVPGHKDVGGETLSADVLQQDRGLTNNLRLLFVNSPYTHIVYEDIGTGLKWQQRFLLYRCVDQGLT